MQTNDMISKTCIVTGANSGIGFATAQGLAKLGARVVMLCRSERRGRQALEKIRKEFMASVPNLKDKS